MNRMHTKQGLVRFTLFIFSLWFSALAESLIICGSCGTEGAQGARYCSHCGGSLGGAAASESTAPAAPQAAPPKSLQNLAEIAGKAAQECVLAGRKQHQTGRPDVARMLYINALSIAGIDPAVLTPAQGDALQKEMRACEDTLSKIRVECPVCQGSGRRTMSVTGLGGSPNGGQATSVSSGIRCDACGGSGKRVRRRTVGERKAAQGQGTQAAEQVFRSLGLVQEGHAWIPQELVPQLDLVQRCRLRRAAAAPCQECQGFGLADCNKCGSTGFVPCKAKGCTHGMMEDAPLNSLDSKAVAIKSRKPCPMCKGTSQVVCTSCTGRGALTCPKCEGQGRRSLCNTCGGEGIGVCTLCRGTGEAKNQNRNAPAAKCPSCEGTGKAFCKSCHGECYGK